MDTLIIVILYVLFMAVIDMLPARKRIRLKERSEDSEDKKSFGKAVIDTALDLLRTFLKIAFYLFDFAPLFLVFHFMPWWVKVIVIVLYIAAKIFVPVVGLIFELLLWISAFICSFMIPIDATIIVFYVLFAIWVLFRIVPITLKLLARR